MIKKCKVLINNTLVTVIDYDGVLIQLPSIKDNLEYVNVKKIGNRYIITQDAFIKNKQNNQKRKKKKTTVQEIIE